MHGVRAAIARTDPLATAEFATIRERLIKISARVIEHIARIRVPVANELPRPLFRGVALAVMPGRVPGIHVFGLCEEQDVDGIESGGPASARNDEAHIG